MEKEFEDYWKKHQKRLILNAPKELRDEYLESTRLDTPDGLGVFCHTDSIGHRFAA